MSPARLCPLTELDGRDLSAWRELADVAVEPNPFWDPDFVLSAARGLGQLREVAILHVPREGGWSACLPVSRRIGWHRLPLPGIASWRHSYCLLGTPLLAPGAEAAEAEAMIAGAMAARRTTFAGFEWVSSGGPFDADVGGAAFERFSRATLHRRDEPDYLEGRVKGKHRREFRRLAQGLEAELGGELELVDRAGEEDAVDLFLRLEAAGWKGRNGTALASDTGHARFFRDLSAAFASRGRLELLFLEGAGRVAAARCSLLAGDASFCFKVAFDEELRRFSPGRELELRLIDRFHANPALGWMDSCADSTNELFNRLWPDRRELLTTVYRTPGPLGALAAGGLRAIAAARERRRRSARSGD